MNLPRLLFLAAFTLMGLAAVIDIADRSPTVIARPGSLALVVHDPFESLTLHWRPLGVAHYTEAIQ